MKRTLIVAAVALACAAGAAGAQDSASPTPAQIVAARQASLDLSGVAMGAIKAGLDAGAPPASQNFAVSTLAKWAVVLPTMFPEGTGSDSMPGVTKAKAEIWTNRADFDAKAADYAAATARLQELTAAGDAAGMAAQWATVRQTCGACHQVYRE